MLTSVAVGSFLALVTCSEAFDRIHGANYGSRFVVEKFFGLYQTDDVFFKDISSGSPGKDPSMCDVNTADAGSRMSTYLDGVIKDYHFTKMASMGFNTIRFPLGYWNLIDLPAGSTPNGPSAASARWQNLQNIMPANNYMKWINLVFQHAASSGIKVLLDLHGAPGSQSGNSNTGCDLGADENTYWDTDWNKQLSLQSIEAMAQICADKGSACWGISLLNEPYSPWSGRGISRDSLKNFYVDAIRRARVHLGSDVPILINDWPDWIGSYWKNEASTFKGAEFGKVAFSTHFYQWDQTTDLASAERKFDGNFNSVQDFQSSTGFDLIFTEYAFNSHGSGGDDDPFDYNGLADYFVHRFDDVGKGSFVWNFDSFYSAWGPVDHADKVGQRPIHWKTIFHTSPGPAPTPAPPGPPSPPTPSSGCCSWDNVQCGGTTEYCETQAHCEGDCNGKWIHASVHNSLIV